MDAGFEERPETPSEPASLEDTQKFLDAYGVVDPSGVADAASGGISAYNGEYGSAAISILSILGFDLLKLLRRGKKAAKAGVEVAEAGVKAADDVAAPLVKNADEVAAASKALPPLTGKRWPNQSPETLAEELKIAANLGVMPIKVTSRESLAGLAGRPIKFAVSESGELLAIPRGVRLGDTFQEISHAVLVNGADVLAAGEGMVTGTVARINRYTGHYKVDQASLEIAKEAFRRAGFTVE